MKDKKVSYVMRQLGPGETGTLAIVASSRVSAEKAAKAAALKLEKGTIIAVHFDEKNYLFDARWHAYVSPAWDKKYLLT